MSPPKMPCFLRFRLNNQIGDLKARAIRASILAALLLLGQVSFGLWWLVFIVAGLMIYAAICISFALYFWWADRH